MVALSTCDLVLVKEYLEDLSMTVSHSRQDLIRFTQVVCSWLITCWTGTRKWTTLPFSPKANCDIEKWGMIQYSSLAYELTVWRWIRCHIAYDDHEIWYHMTYGEGIRCHMKDGITE